ncbi:MAG: hypothetical protein JRC60_07930 [Deltaproteobacteria bacterium]|nr:hypothetical protein [Deltaproteobacteria bacterium]
MKKLITPLIVIITVALPALLHPLPGIRVPCTIGETVEDPLYVQYWEARLYHGAYTAWEEHGTLWFRRDGQVIEYKARKKAKRRTL